MQIKWDMYVKLLAQEAIDDGDGDDDNSESHSSGVFWGTLAKGSQERTLALDWILFLFPLLGNFIHARTYSMIMSWYPDWHPSCREQQVISPTDSQNSTQLLLPCHLSPFFLWLECTCHCKRRNSSPDSLGMPKFRASSLSLGSNSGDWGAQILGRMEHPGRLPPLQPQTIPIPIQELCWSLTTSFISGQLFFCRGSFPFWN